MVAPFIGETKLVHAEATTHEAMTDELVRVLVSFESYLSQFQLWLDYDQTRRRVREAKVVLPVFQALQSHAKLIDRLLLDDWVRKDGLYKAMRRVERLIENLGVQG